MYALCHFPRSKKTFDISPFALRHFLPTFPQKLNFRGNLIWPQLFIPRRQTRTWPRIFSIMGKFARRDRLVVFSSVVKISFRRQFFRAIWVTDAAVNFQLRRNEIAFLVRLLIENLISADQARAFTDENGERVAHFGAEPAIWKVCAKDGDNIRRSA